MKVLRSYNIEIWVGMRVGYTDQILTMDFFRGLCDGYLLGTRDCITITPTEFRYVHGNEPGIIIGMVQYPRFPRTRRKIRENAFKLAEILMTEMGQERVTITTPYKAYMLENKKNGKGTN